MTAQTPETLLHGEETLNMCTEPLEEYFAMSRSRPRFLATRPDLRRGYVGAWALLSKRLYLVGIEGLYPDQTPITLDSLFPGFAERVFAHWFTGVARCPRGKRLHFVHVGYLSTYEKDLILRFERGVLIKESLLENSASLLGTPITPGAEGSTRFQTVPDINGWVH